MMRTAGLVFSVFVLAVLGPAAGAMTTEPYSGQFSRTPFGPNPPASPYSSTVNPSQKSINNPYDHYASPYASERAANPYSNSGPALREQNGNVRGNLNGDSFDHRSISNPYGRYGSTYTPGIITNPVGRLGVPYSPPGPNIPFGQGLSIYGR